jgi:hypothetical protein
MGFRDHRILNWGRRVYMGDQSAGALSQRGLRWHAVLVQDPVAPRATRSRYSLRLSGSRSIRGRSGIVPRTSW